MILLTLHLLLLAALCAGALWLIVGGSDNDH